MAQHKIRTTFQPDVELKVDDAEFTDLSRQGVVLDADGARKSTARSGGSNETSKEN